MTKPIDKINWYYILVGLFLLFGYFYPKKTTIDDINLTTKTITLSHNIEFIKGNSKSNSFHRLWTNETKAAFTINVPGEIAAKCTLLDSLRKGDSLRIKYSSKREIDIEDATKEIPIYFLQKVDKLYFDTTAYNHSKADYERRRNLLMLIGGIFLTLRGLTIINSKIAYILAALSIVTIVVLKLLNKF